MVIDFPGGLKPDSASDFYLLAILEELRAIRGARAQACASCAQVVVPEEVTA